MISAGERLTVPAREAVAGATPDPELYEAYVALIRRCWAQRPEERPGFAEIIQDLRCGGAGLHGCLGAWGCGTVALLWGLPLCQLGARLCWLPPHSTCLAGP